MACRRRAGGSARKLHQIPAAPESHDLSLLAAEIMVRISSEPLSGHAGGGVDPRM